MDSDPRRAIVDRREQVGAEPRPTRLSQVDLREQAGAVREADDLHRLYRPEWVSVHVEAAVDGDRTPEALTEAALAHFDAHYDGRVHSGDMRLAVAGAGPTARVALQLRLPNLKGEFKTAALAHAHATGQGWDDYTVVGRNTKADHELRGYGVKKLAGG